MSKKNAGICARGMDSHKTELTAFSAADIVYSIRLRVLMLCSLSVGE